MSKQSVEQSGAATTTAGQATAQPVAQPVATQLPFFGPHLPRTPENARRPSGPTDRQMHPKRYR